MPVAAYNGDPTFLAFLDIAGFTEMMREKQARAVRALSAFYTAGYNALGATHQSLCRVDGFFISDCGILFVRSGNSPVHQLSALLDVVERIHWASFKQTVQLTTSIAYGAFAYHERLEFDGIGKTPIHGEAYLAAYFDNSSGTPRLYANDVRVLKKGLPVDVLAYLSNPQETRIRDDTSHFYFEWMRDAAEVRDDRPVRVMG